MMTGELKRSQESYIQRVLDIARQMPKVGSPNIRRQYYALKDICYGLRSATKGLQALQELYGKNDLSSHFLDLRGLSQHSSGGIYRIARRDGQDNRDRDAHYEVFFLQFVTVLHLTLECAGKKQEL